MQKADRLSFLSAARAVLVLCSVQYQLNVFVAGEGGKVYRTLQVQVVHRHGDRSPITPLKDEEFWASTLIRPEILENISKQTSLIENNNEANGHNAGGRGPFGKLSELGLFQMISVGNTLREKLVTEDPDTFLEDDKGNRVYSHVFTPERPLHPKNMRVISTNFLRTIQSVRGALVGLFPDGIPENVPIDVRHTDIMIPDPQPRRTPEQEELENTIAASPVLLAKEREMLPLAVRTTQALHDMLAPDAHEASFGVKQDRPGDFSIETEPLQWNQLAELTKCLSVRAMLPPGVTKEDQEVIAEHTAWRWFQTLRHPRLAYLAMHTVTSRQVDYLLNHTDEPALTIWSAHDSTLIGLLCAYRLEQPAIWPEYASYLLLELIEVENVADERKELFVRFSLNGEVLKSHWEGEDSFEMIPLTLLKKKIDSVGDIPSQSTTAERV